MGPHQNTLPMDEDLLTGKQNWNSSFPPVQHGMSFLHYLCFIYDAVISLLVLHSPCCFIIITTTIIMIITLFSYHRFSFPLYFSNGEPHHLGFKSKIVALSL
jgi:hypothetical protein